MINRNEEHEERFFHTIIKEICEENNIEVTKLSYDWILQLKKDGKIRHITGNRFDINKESAGDICCDKYATYEVLSSQKIPVIEHKMIFNPTCRSKYINENGIWSEIIDFFYKNDKKIVVKPNSGCEGQGVELCQSLKEVEIAIHKLFKNHGSLSICPYYEIDTEYRTFYLDGECYLIYGKTRPNVIGDGNHTIKELLSINNIYMPENNVVKDNFNSIDLNYIPKKNEIYYLSWKHNLSGGAVPCIVNEGVLKNKIIELVRKTGKAANIDFATVDVIETNEKELYVMEINSGVCMTKFVEQIPEGRDIAKKIYSKAIDRLFK